MCRTQNHLEITKSFQSSRYAASASEIVIELFGVDWVEHVVEQEKRRASACSVVDDSTKLESQHWSRVLPYAGLGQASLDLRDFLRNIFKSMQTQIYYTTKNNFYK